MNVDNLVAFYDARELFISWRDYRKGFVLLQQCPHPEAVYVCSLFPRGLPKTKEEIAATFLAQGTAIATCYAGFFYVFRNELFYDAARRGVPLAMAECAWFERGAIRFEWAQKAAKAGEREGMMLLGDCFWRGDGCVQDTVQATEMYKQAADLGHEHGMINYAVRRFSRDDFERYEWFGRSCVTSGHWYALVDETLEHVRRYDDGNGNVACLFVIGRAWNGHENRVANRHRTTVCRAVRMYKETIEQARAAVLCWLLCARYRGLYKDVAKIVAAMVWTDRHTFMDMDKKQQPVKKVKKI